MGFISQEKPYYDLGINGYLPENTDFHKQTIPNWEKYINILDRMDRQEELVYIPTAISRTNHIMRAHEFDKDGNNLESLLVVPNFYDPNKLRTSLNTGSSIVDFVLRHNITGQSHFETKDTEFKETLHKNTDFVNGGIKNYLESTGQTLNNINGKIARAQIWRYYIRTVDNQFTDNHPMLQELLIIGLIHSGDLEEPHLSPHMMKYCKLNLTNGTNISCRPYTEVQNPATFAAFSGTDGRTGLTTPFVWTLDEFHINGIDAVCAKLDRRLYSFLQSTLPKFFLDHAANNSEIKGSGVNLISYINKNFGKLSYADGVDIKRQLDNWKKLSITTAPLKSLNTFHEKYLLYQDVISPKNGNTSMKDREQTIKHAMISLLGDDYGRERKVSLSEKVQQDESLTVVSLINKIVELQNHYHNLNVNGRTNQGQSSHGKRKNYNNRDDFKRQNTSNRNGQSFDRPICKVLRQTPQWQVH